MLLRNTIITALLLTLAASCFAWTPELNLTPNNGLWLVSTDIAVDTSNRVHVVYIKTINSSVWKIYHTYQSGGVFTPEQEVTPLNSKEPQVALFAGPSNKLYMLSLGRGGANNEYTIFFREWNGSSWSSAFQVSDGNSFCTAPRAAVDQWGTFHITWQQTKTSDSGDIMYRSRTSSGSWSGIKNVTANRSGTSYGSCNPDIACDYSGSGVHIVWHDDFLDDGFQTYYMKSNDSGATWPGSAGWVQLSVGAYAKGPRIFVDRNNAIHTFWTDRQGVNVGAYRKYTGGVWGGISYLGQKFIEGGVVTPDNVMHVVYFSSPTGTVELFHDYMNGSNYAGVNELISNGENTQKGAYGAIAADSSGTLHAAWQERKTWSNEIPFIFYSKGINTPPPGPVTNFTATAVSSSQVNLAWKNPANANYTGTIIRFKYDGYPSSAYDGNLLATRPAAPGSNDAISHTGLQPGQFVYYTAFAYNSESIYSTGAPASARTVSKYNDHGAIGTGSRPFAIAAAPNGMIYTGTDGTDTQRGTFGRYNPATNQWTNLNLPYTGRVLSLYVHSNGNVYGCQGGTATSSEGKGGVFWSYNPSNGVYTNILTDTTGTQVQGEISEGSDGRVWFANSVLNIVCYDPKLPKSASNPRVYTKPAGITQYLVGGIEVTPDGTVYACWNANTAPFDMFKLNPATGQWTRVTTPITLSTEYACNRLIGANDGYIYGITARADGHIFRLDPKSDSILDYGGQFPPGSWGSSSRHIVGAAWAETGRLYWGSSQDTNSDAHMFYFDRAKPAGTYNGSTDNGVLPTDTRDIHSVCYSKGRVYLGVRQDNATPRLWSFDVAGTAASPSISQLTEMPNGSTITLNTRTVTAGFGSHFYIEDMDRIAGIKVASSAAATTGSIVSVTGKLEVVDGERQISPTSVAVYSGGNPVPDPFLWNIRALGGGTLAAKPGIADGCGLNNIGLLGTIAGRVVGIGAGSAFYVDDGTNSISDEGFTGVKVISTKNIQTGQFVIVTGISSVAINEDQQPVRQIKTRSDADVVVLP